MPKDGNDRFVHFPAVPHDRGIREEVQSETTRFQAQSFYNGHAHDDPGPDHEHAHGLADEEQHLFPVVKLYGQKDKAGHNIFDPLAQGYSILNTMAYEESVDHLQNRDNDWPIKEHSVNDIEYEDPYDLAEVKQVRR